MAKQKVQAQKTYWLEAEIEAETATEALDLIDAFDIDWEEVEERHEFTGVYWTEETGLVNDPIDEILRLQAIIKRLKDEFDIEADWAN